jgi:hypothetical protein
MRDLKRTSSLWVTESSHTPGFAWQEGYAALTVSASARTAIQDYINSQEKHHRHKTFREELIDILRKAEIEYDPRYLD